MELNLDPTEALKLSHEREKGAWKSMQEGLKSLGNLDTYIKDRNLTEGREPTGVFGGWKAMRDPAKVEAAEAEESASAKKPVSWFGQKQPELADIHRWAMLRGLNHDQATIDEKTGRPERDRQYDLSIEKMQRDAELRAMGYTQDDIDNARKMYEAADDHARAELGHINELNKEIQSHRDRGLTPPQELVEEMRVAQARMQRYSTNRDAAYDYLSGKKGEGRKPSQFLGIGDPPADAAAGGAGEAEQGDAATPQRMGPDVYAKIENFAKGHRVEHENKFDQFFDTLGLDESLRVVARTAYKKDVELNKHLAELANDDKENAARIKNLINSSVGNENAALMEKGIRMSIEKFLAGDTSYSTANANKLQELVKKYQYANPRGVLENVKDFITGGSKAAYEQNLAIIREGFGIPDKAADQPPAKESFGDVGKYR